MSSGRSTNRFVERLVERTKGHCGVGHRARFPATQVAPLITPEHSASVEAYVYLARQGGRRDPGRRRPAGGAGLRTPAASTCPPVVRGLAGRGADSAGRRSSVPVLVGCCRIDDEDDPAPAPRLGLRPTLPGSVGGTTGASGASPAGWGRGRCGSTPISSSRSPRPFADEGRGPRARKGHARDPPLYAPERPLLDAWAERPWPWGPGESGCEQPTKNCHNPAKAGIFAASLLPTNARRPSRSPAFEGMTPGVEESCLALNPHPWSSAAGRGLTAANSALSRAARHRGRPGRGQALQIAVLGVGIIQTNKRPAYGVRRTRSTCWKPCLAAGFPTEPAGSISTAPARC